MFQPQNLIELVSDLVEEGGWHPQTRAIRAARPIEVHGGGAKWNDPKERQLILSIEIEQKRGIHALANYYFGTKITKLIPHPYHERIKKEKIEEMSSSETEKKRQIKWVFLDFLYNSGS